MAETAEINYGTRVEMFAWIILYGQLDGGEFDWDAMDWKRDQS